MPQILLPSQTADTIPIQGSDIWIFAVETSVNVINLYGVNSQIKTFKNPQLISMSGQALRNASQVTAKISLVKALSAVHIYLHCMPRGSHFHTAN